MGVSVELRQRLEKNIWKDPKRDPGAIAGVLYHHYVSEQKLASECIDQTVAPAMFLVVDRLARHLFGFADPLEESVFQQVVSLLHNGNDPIPQSHPNFTISRVISVAAVSGFREAFRRYHMTEDQAVSLVSLVSLGFVVSCSDSAQYQIRQDELRQTIVRPLQRDPYGELWLKHLPINLVEVPFALCGPRLEVHEPGVLCQEGAVDWAETVGRVLG